MIADGSDQGGSADQGEHDTEEAPPFVRESAGSDKVARVRDEVHAFSQHRVYHTPVDGVACACVAVRDETKGFTSQFARFESVRHTWARLRDHAIDAVCAGSLGRDGADPKPVFVTHGGAVFRDFFVWRIGCPREHRWPFERVFDDDGKLVVLEWNQVRANRKRAGFPRLAAGDPVGCRTCREEGGSERDQKQPPEPRGFEGLGMACGRSAHHRLAHLIEHILCRAS